MGGGGFGGDFEEVFGAILRGFLGAIFEGFAVWLV